MQTTRHFHMELRHATLPTYVFSYLFPLVLLAYELWRVGSWVAVRGFNFADFSSMGYEFALMAAAMLTKHHDVAHRAGNLLLGLFCSVVVLGFDLALQYAM
jgi:hypothetical protein